MTILKANKVIAFIIFLCFILGFYGFYDESYALTENELYADMQKIEFLNTTYNNSNFTEICRLYNNDFSTLISLIASYVNIENYNQYFVYNDPQSYFLEFWFWNGNTFETGLYTNNTIYGNVRCRTGGKYMQINYDVVTHFFTSVASQGDFTTTNGKSYMYTWSGMQSSYKVLRGYIGSNTILYDRSNNIETSYEYYISTGYYINIDWITPYISGDTPSVFNLADVEIGKDFNKNYITIKTYLNKYNYKVEIVEQTEIVTEKMLNGNTYSLYMNKAVVPPSDRLYSYGVEIDIYYNNVLYKTEEISMPVMSGGSSSEDTSGEIGFVSGEEINGNINSSGDLNINVDNIINSSINNTNKIIENDNKNTDRIVSGEVAIAEAIKSGDQALLEYFNTMPSGDLNYEVPEVENPVQPFYLDFYSNLVGGLRSSGEYFLKVPLPSGDTTFDYMISSKILAWDNPEVDKYLRIFWVVAFGYAFIKWIYFLYEALNEADVNLIFEEIKNDKDIF